MTSLLHLLLTEDDSFSTILDLVLNCACFIYIGAWLPFDQFHIPELDITPWRLVGLMLAILVLRRIPSLLILYKLMPEVSNWREALFCGHFGPIGVGAVFICTLAQTRLEAPQTPPLSQEDLLATALQPIVSFVVLGSILTHGLSIPFFSIGRRTLTISRSLVVDQPDWLLWVRRDAPQVDTERVPVASEDASVVVAQESRRELQKQASQSDLPDTVSKDVKIAKRAVRIDVPRTSTRQSTVVIKEPVEVTLSDDAGTSRCDS